jgi:GH15 family glucan-1,4-alpha-glucosidase
VDLSDGSAQQDALASAMPSQAPMRQLAPDITLGGSAFPPIADYAFLSDCETVALVAPSGNVEWMCLPRVDSPSVFGAMLDRDAGAFRIGPSGVAVPASRRYLPVFQLVSSTIVPAVMAIGNELTDHGLVLRYRTDETDDGLSGEEGTFLICSFWLVSAYCEIGEIDRARNLCERVLGFASPLGLYAEEVSSHTGRHLGNFPQAFTHLALINAVMHVIRADQELAQARSPWSDWR